MRSLRFILLSTLILAASPALCGKVSESSLGKQIDGLRDVPDAKRPAMMIQIANDIRTLPVGAAKLRLADVLTHLVTEGDSGHEALQAAADTLALALTESPQPAKDGLPPRPYLDLARLVRYEDVTTQLKDPLLAQADAILAANDAEVEKTDFTLKDLNGKKYTLSDLRGKIVLVNFWATWCPPCRKEMPDLDAIYTHYQSQGLVILSITAEDSLKVSSFMNGYHPPILLDEGGKVSKQFHVDGLPRSFVFDREGKLVAETIDMRTQHQFFMMLAKAGLHP